MENPVEVNMPYSYPQEVCYSVLKDNVIPAMKVAFKLAYRSLKIPYGSIGLSVLDDDWRAYKLTAKMQYLGLVKYTWGTPIKIYSRSTGPDTTIVEIVADAAKFYDGQFMNTLLDVTYKKIPGYSWLVRKMLPDYYFDETRVLDSKKLKDQSFRHDLWRTALSYLFHKSHDLLSENLKQVDTGF